jgi:Cell Wall Hydrolase
MAKIRISKAKKSGFARQPGWRGMFAFCVVALVTSCVMPLAASRNPGPASSLTVALDPPKPLDQTENVATVLEAALPPIQSEAEILVEAKLAGAGLAAANLTPAVLSGPTGVVAPYTPSAFNPGPAATSLIFRGRSALDNLRSQLCLTAAIYYEAANEPDAGQRAVAQVVLNRVRHPAWPNTVCDVVYQGTERPGVLCQFSFACDGSMARIPVATSWARARRVAQEALAGYVFAPVGLATFYHTLAVSPSWNRAMNPSAIFGAHIFYRLPGGAGEPRSYHAGYFGREPVPGPRAKLFVPTAPSLPPYQMAGVGGQQAYPAMKNAPAGADLAMLAQLQAQSQMQSAAAAQSITQVASIAPTKSVAADRRYLPGSLPESSIRSEFQGSGEWIGK